jgi:hypothetical protein
LEKADAEARKELVLPSPAFWSMPMTPPWLCEFLIAVIVSASQFDCGVRSDDDDALETEDMRRFLTAARLHDVS